MATRSSTRRAPVARESARLVTVGRALPGMANYDKNVSTNITFRDGKHLLMLRQALEEKGCVRVEIEEESLVAKRLFRDSGVKMSWEEKLDDLQRRAPDNRPCLFVLFRKAHDVLLIKYIPDRMATRMKMLYASSTSSVKSILLDVGDDQMKIEEYFVSTRTELNTRAYYESKNIEAPLTDAEIARKEQEEAETGGGYSILARLTAEGVIALPGMARDGPMPEFLKRMTSQADEREERDYDDQQYERHDEEDNDDVGDFRRSIRKSSMRPISMRVRKSLRIINEKVVAPLNKKIQNQIKSIEDRRKSRQKIEPHRRKTNEEDMLQKNKPTMYEYSVDEVPL